MADKVPSVPVPRPLPKPPSTAETKGRSRFNFLAASSRDKIIFGSERPGQPRPNPDQPSTPRGPLVATHVVDQWCAHMRSKGIRRVLCLLNDSELSFFAEPLIQQLQRHFSTKGPAVAATEGAKAAANDNGSEGGSASPVVVPPLNEAVRHIAPHAEDALAGIIGCMDAAVEAGEPLVCFCSTGQARTGMVLAFWLHRKYSMPVAAAVTETIEHAAANGATRKPSVEQVMQFAIGPGARTMLPSMRQTAMMGGSGGAVAFGTPRVDDRMHITFLQTGGTIDKDYPRLMGGYAFEITDPAVQRILKVAVPAGFTHDVMSVCRKDSQELTVEDRQALVETIRRVPNSSKFIVTHGSDTMIETAQYVAAAKGIINKTVVFTGAMRPQKMSDSDAAFNVGVAVGALNVLGSGVYLAMNGRVHDAANVRRDGRTGLFVAI